MSYIRKLIGLYWSSEVRQHMYHVTRALLSIPGSFGFYVASCQCYVDDFPYHVNTYLACLWSKGAAAALSSTRILHTDSPFCAASTCRPKVIVTISLGIRTQNLCQSQSLPKPLTHYYYITKSRSQTQPCPS